MLSVSLFILIKKNLFPQLNFLPLWIIKCWKCFQLKEELTNWCISRRGSVLSPPGLAAGESMDLDSLLPPALSESLHIPPWLAWPEEAQFLSAIGPFSAARRQNGPYVRRKTKKKCNWTISCFVVFLVLAIFHEWTTQIFPLWSVLATTEWLRTVPGERIPKANANCLPSVWRNVTDFYIHGRKVNIIRCGIFFYLSLNLLFCCKNVVEKPCASLLIFVGCCSAKSNSSPLSTSPEVMDAWDRLPWEECVLPSDLWLYTNLWGNKKVGAQGSSPQNSLRERCCCPTARYWAVDHHRWHFWSQTRLMLP